MSTVSHPRRQGDLGELSAMQWLAAQGASLFVPFEHSPDVDLIAELRGELLRVQVKTCTHRRNGRWSVTLSTRGGNRSWSGVVKRFGGGRCDVLFVLVGDGRRWFIPADVVSAETTLVLGGPKYAAYEIERGEPIARPSLD